LTSGGFRIVSDTLV